MAGLHSVHQPTEDFHPGEARKNSRIGLRLFFLYTMVYGLYVVINAFVPSWMEWIPFWGLNLAILSGFGLIALAVILAFWYGYLCSRQTESR